MISLLFTGRTVPDMIISKIDFGVPGGEGGGLTRILLLLMFVVVAAVAFLDSGREGFPGNMGDPLPDGGGAEDCIVDILCL